MYLIRNLFILIGIRVHVDAIRAKLVDFFDAHGRAHIRTRVLYLHVETTPRSLVRALQIFYRDNLWKR